MPSTPSQRLLAEKQAAGENLNTWGLRLNTVIDMIDAAVRGRAAVVVSGPVTLASSNYALSEDTYGFIDISGTGGTLTFPNRESIKLVRNAASGSVTITTGAGASVSIGAGVSTIITCDGSNVREALAVGALGWKAYVDAQAFAALDGDLPGQAGSAGKALTTDGSVASWDNIPQSTVTGLAAALALLAPLASPAFTGNPSFAAGATMDGTIKSNEVDLNGTTVINVGSAHFFRDSISSNKTYTFTGDTSGEAEAFVLTLTISSSAIPSFPAAVEWPGGSEPPFSNGKHVIGFLKSNNVWNGALLRSGVS